MLNPSTTPPGFFVNLVKFVELVVAHNVYKKAFLSGLRVGIYGDAMSRGSENGIPNFRSGIESEQSFTHVFTFAVFDVSFYSVPIWFHEIYIYPPR